MEPIDVLVVDDEQLIINSISRTLRSDGYTVRGTTSPCEALQILRNQEIAIIFCDQRMPAMPGTEVLIKAKEIAPNTIRILITGYSDINVVIAAINEGHIFRYLAKPWGKEDLLKQVKEALLHRESILKIDQLLHELLKDKDDWKKAVVEYSSLVDVNNRSAINSLLKIMKIKDPELLEHCQRVSVCAALIAKRLGFTFEQHENLHLACLFHDIGKIAIRDKTLYKAGPLDSEEFKSIKLHPSYGSEIIRELNVLDRVGEIILQHHEKIDGTGYPQQLKGDDIIIEARILAVADAYDSLVSDRVYRKGVSHDTALQKLKKDQGIHFDFDVVECMLTIDMQELNSNQRTKDNGEDIKI